MSTCETEDWRPDDNDVLAQRFVVRKELGRGAFGQVLLAHDRKLQRDVAIKLPRSDQFSGPGELQAFLEEARALARLSHPRIVPIYDVEECSDGRSLLVMQFINGPSLSQRIKRNPRPSKALVVKWLLQVGEGLRYVHRHGCVHCDLKPGNILLDRSENAYVADFGLARYEGGGLPRRPFAGSLPYMAPEQVRGAAHAVDGRTDIWALGVVLYELLTGERPFRGDRVRLREQILTSQPESPRQINSSISVTLERLCLKCLAKSPNERFQNMADLLEELELFSASWQDNPTTRRGLVAGVALVLIAGFSIAYGLYQPRAPRPEETTANRSLAIHWNASGQRFTPERELFDVHDATTVYSGDQLRVKFKPTSDCYVYLVNVDQKEATLIFPHNQISLESHCRAEVEYTVPDGIKWFQLNDVVGEEAIYLIASQTRLSKLEDLLTSKGSSTTRFTEIGESLQLTRAEAMTLPPNTSITTRGMTIEHDHRYNKVLVGRTHMIYKIVLRHVAGRSEGAGEVRSEH